MNTKQIVYLSLIFLVLMTGVAVKELYKPQQLSRDIYEDLYFEFDPESVREAVLQEGASEKQIRLVKSNGDWRLPDFWNARAQDAKIEPFLDKIKNAKGELRAQEGALLEDFQISDDQGFRIILKEANAEPVLDFRIGASKADYGTSFVRQTGSDAVYLADVNLLGAIGVYGDAAQQGLSVNHWTDLRLLGWENDDIVQAVFSRIEKNKRERKAGIQRTGEVDWNFWETETSDPKAGREEAGKWIRSMTDWTANEIVAPESAAEIFENPEWEIRLVSSSGREVTLTGARQGETEDGQFYVQVSSEEPVFKVSKFHYEELQTSVEDLTARADDAAA